MTKTMNAIIAKYIIGTGSVKHYSYWCYDAGKPFGEIIAEAKPHIIDWLNAQVEMAGADPDFVKQWKSLTEQQKQTAWIPYVKGELFGAEEPSDVLDWLAEFEEPAEIVEKHCWKIMDF